MAGSIILMERIEREDLELVVLSLQNLDIEATLFNYEGMFYIDIAPKGYDTKASLRVSGTQLIPTSECEYLTVDISDPSSFEKLAKNIHRCMHYDDFCCDENKQCCEGLITNS
jgi:hypothetical protein